MRTQIKRIALAVGAAALVMWVPEWLGPGPSANFLIGERLAAGALLGPLALIFLGGLLTALTPCVYPLIPITVSVFGATKQASRGRALALTSTYIGAMALLFTGLGVGAAMTGGAFGSTLGNPYVVSAIAAMLTLFALSMFGAYDFQLPVSLQTKLGGMGRAGFGGAFAMGLVAGVVAAPCTGPVLSGILVHVAATQNALLGAVLLLAYSLGLGLPFFLIGVFSVRLPKSGAWMEAVKSVFGIALLALALMYLRDAFPALRTALTLKTVGYGALVAAALVFAGVAAGALHRSFHAWPADGLLKAVGVALVVAGLTLRPGAPLANYRQPQLTWAAAMEPALGTSVAAGKPVIVDFFAEWCAACKELDKYVYTDPDFAREAERFTLVKIDGTNDSEELDALYERYAIEGLPTVLFIDSTGKVREDLTLKGFVEAPVFVERMQKVK